MCVAATVCQHNWDGGVAQSLGEGDIVLAFVRKTNVKCHHRGSGLLQILEGGSVVVPGERKEPDGADTLVVDADDDDVRIGGRPGSAHDSILGVD